jgi:hypothetical protein
VGQPRTTLGQSEIRASIAVVHLGGLVDSVARPEQPDLRALSPSKLSRLNGGPRDVAFPASSSASSTWVRLGRWPGTWT